MFFVRFFIFVLFVMILSAEEKALYYSLDDTLGIKDLRNGEVETVLSTEALYSRMKKNAIKRCLADTEGYPFKFHKVPSKPYIFYYQGDISLLNMPILGIVGPRKVSSYATKVMEDIFDAMGDYKLVTLSGGAPGVDTLCHDLSLKHGIPTIMVLGGGL